MKNDEVDVQVEMEKIKFQELKKSKRDKEFKK